MPQTAGLAAVGLAGTLAPETIALAHDWVGRLPRELTSAAHRADGARAICYLIARDPDASADADALVASTDPDAAAAYRSLAELVARQSSVGQLALADLAAPALANLGRPGYSRFRATLGQVMRSDKRIDLREWALTKSLERHVERRFVEGPSPAHSTIAEMEQQACIVLAIIAVTQHDASVNADAYRRGVAHLGLQRMTMPSAAELTLDSLNEAVRRLSKCRYIERERLLEACALTAMADGSATDTEMLVVRSVADALDVPVPALTVA